MVKVLFVCLGNICRSPMAQAVFGKMVEERGLQEQIQIDSAATGTWNLGKAVHQGTRERLAKENISVEGMYARLLNDKDLEADYIIGMDSSNMNNIERLIGNQTEAKMAKLLEFANEDGDIADPYYTGNFDITYDDVVRGSKGLLDYIMTNDLS